ncbi:hypothetical protein J3R82DRAFT_1632, partial [Butyriboletus roseoflavus]
KEEQEAKKEKKKKYKNKFMPIPNRSLLATALLPSQHMLSKFQKVSLYYFTNKGIHKVEEDGSGDKDLLTLTRQTKAPSSKPA